MAVPWLNTTAADEVPTAEGNSHSRGGPMVMAAGSWVGEQCLIAGMRLAVTVVSIHGRSMLPSVRQLEKMRQSMPWLLNGRFDDCTLEMQRWQQGALRGTAGQQRSAQEHAA
jgi:hypothetical protein